MARGDQVYAMREVVGVPYQHHGIDCGDGTIIHYSKIGETTVRRTSREVFGRGGPIYIKPVGPQATVFIPQVVIERAESRLGEQQYDLFFNNCEHFANWCKTGRNESAQLRNFGLRFDQIKQPQVGDFIGDLARRSRQEVSPERTRRLFQEALDNVAIATQTLLPQYEQASTDTLTWHRVAQRALTQNREDLARAALYRKVAAQKEADTLKAQLKQLSDLQLSLLQNQAKLES